MTSTPFENPSSDNWASETSNDENFVNSGQTCSLTVPLVGPPESLETLVTDYQGHSQYLAKVRWLINHCHAFRRIKKDGCCFYRAFLFGMCEHLLHHKSELQEFINRLKGELLTQTKNAGYVFSTVDDFFQDCVECLEMLNSPDANVAVVESILNPLQESNGFVTVARLLTATYMKLNKELFEPFIVNQGTIEEYCKEHVDPMWEEAEHLQIIALAKALRMPVSILCLDQSPGDVPVRHVLPEGEIPKVHLLFQPGHYDVIYPKV